MDQVFLITNEADVVTNEEHMTCPQRAETKSAREEQFASQSWEALRESGNPVCDLVCEIQPCSQARFRRNFLLIVVFGTRSISCQDLSIA